MTGARRQLDLTDMANLPMSAGWYWELGYLRDVLRNVASQHAAAVRGRRPALGESDRHMVAQLHAACAIEHVDRLRLTMEAAGVLSTNG